MLRLLLIDDHNCRKELSDFIKKHQDAIRVIAQPKELLAKINDLFQAVANQNGGQKRIVINTTESITMLDVADIIRCESNRNYTYMHMANKKKLIVSKTLMEFEELLGKYNFIRVHKSHLINVNYIEKYIKSDGGYMMLKDGSKLPVSVRKKEYLFDQLEKL